MGWREIVEAAMPKRSARRCFKELEIVRLSRSFDGPDGRIPSGTQGTVLQVFGDGEAYQVEFEGAHDVPETVPAALLVSSAPSAQR